MATDSIFLVHCPPIYAQFLAPPVRTETTGEEPRPTSPLDLQRHLGDLLASMVGGDVAFEVDGERARCSRHTGMCSLHGHLCSWRSFLSDESEGHGSHMYPWHGREGVQGPCSISPDSMPVMDECDKTVMCQHLFLAADRYNLQRLKLICEDMLSSSVDISTAVTTLVLAEQHGCAGLKDACFKFLKAPGNMKAVMATDGFQHLKNSCPSLLEELLAMVAPLTC